MTARIKASKGATESATIPAPDKPVRYVELVRVSGQAQVDKLTPENQRRALDQLQKQRGGVRVERIEAMAVSATKAIEDTAEGRRLLELGRRQAFDELRVFDADRVFGMRADKGTDRLAVFTLCLDAGALLVDCTGRVIDPAEDSGFGEFELYMRGFVAAQERKKIERRTKAGRLRVADEGGNPSGPGPYACKWDKVMRRWSFDTDELRTLKQMITWAREGMTSTMIATKLNQRGIVTRRGGKWSNETVAMKLTSRSLIGDFMHSGKTIPVPPVMTQVEYRRLQDVLSTHKPKGRAPKSTGALFVGRACCVCGRAMYPRRTSSAREYYVCSSVHSGQRVKGLPPCPYAKWIRIEGVDDAAWEIIAADIKKGSDWILRERLGYQGVDDTGALAEERNRCVKMLTELAEREAEVSARYARSGSTGTSKVTKDARTKAWQAALDAFDSQRVILEATLRTTEDAIAAAGAGMTLMSELDELDAFLAADDGSEYDQASNSWVQVRPATKAPKKTAKHLAAPATAAEAMYAVVERSIKEYREFIDSFDPEMRRNVVERAIPQREGYGVYLNADGKVERVVWLMQPAGTSVADGTATASQPGVGNLTTSLRRCRATRPAPRASAGRAGRSRPRSTRRAPGAAVAASARRG